MIIKKYGVDFYSEGGALTLSPKYVSDTGFQFGIPDQDNPETQTFTKTHSNGWTITGEIHEDYFEWVNFFEANHPTLGSVWGDFQREVYADSEEAYLDFYKNFPPHAWSKDDI